MSSEELLMAVEPLAPILLQLLVAAGDNWLEVSYNLQDDR